MRAAAAAAVVLLLGPAASVYLVTAETKPEPGGFSLFVPTPGVINKAFSDKFNDGLTHRVRYTLTVREDGKAQPIYSDVLTTEFIFDLWKEQFAVKHSQQAFAKPPVRVSTADKLVTALEKPRFRSLAFVPVPGRAYVADVVVEVDLVSQEAQQRAREMIAPPPRDSEAPGAPSMIGEFMRTLMDASPTAPRGGTFVFRTRAFIPVAAGAAP